MARPWILPARMPGRVPASSATPAISLAAASFPKRAGTQVRWHTYVRPKLDHDLKEYIPNLLSPKGYKLAWTDYQSMLLEKLGNMIAGTTLEGTTTHDIISKTARNPSQAHIFNHASMAFNNHFFFQGVTDQPAPMSPFLKNHLEKSFGSIESLRQTMLVTALAMFGPGFVWLVRVFPQRTQNQDGDLMEHQQIYRLLPTYAAGSPFAEAHWRRQSTDMNTAGETEFRSGPVEGQTMASWQRRDAPVIGDGGGGAAGAPSHLEHRIAPGGVRCVPVLCLNTWEHVWLQDYGFGEGVEGGKREYVQRWWEAIDWDQAWDRGSMNYRKDMDM